MKLEGPDHGPPVVLSIAGSDSGGGAGIQADLKTFTALGVFGTTAISVLTAQNTVGVQAIHTLAPEIVRAQIISVVSDMAPKSVKTGLLGSAEIIALTGKLARQGLLPQLVVDPVAKASTGKSFLNAEAIAAYREHLLPNTHVFTPNIHEAELLCGFAIKSPSDMERAAQLIGQMGPDWVVIKAGHLATDQVSWGQSASGQSASGQSASDQSASDQSASGQSASDRCSDLVWDGKSVRFLDGNRIESRNLHGTGCTFSAAIVSYLGHGVATWQALEYAKAFVSAAITNAVTWKLGFGDGPLNHFGNLQP